MFNFNYKDIDFSHKLDFASSPKDEYTKHMHSFVEILYFVSGDVIYSIDGEKIKLKKGDCVFIRPGRFHFADVNKNISYERYVLKFPENLIPNSIKDKLYSGLTIYNLNKKTEEIFKSLDEYYSLLNDDYMETICISKLLELLVNLVSSNQKKNKINNDSLIQKITNYIQEHIEENITLNKISLDLSYSMSYLSNYFNDEMHISIMKYIRTKRIIYAHSLILSGIKPKEVCERMNFNDYSTFYRQYLKIEGISPIDDYLKIK